MRSSADDVGMLLTRMGVPWDLITRITSYVIKPIHAKWLIDVLSTLGKESDLIKSGFRKAGIV